MAGEPRPEPPVHVAVVGAGIAGAAVTRALIAEGARVTVVEAERAGAGASGFPASLVTPRLDAGDALIAGFHAQALERAGSLYRALAGAVVADILDPLTGEPDPSAYVRLYRDARQVETTHCYVGRRWQDVMGMYPPADELVSHRLRMNTFLGKWLEYLAERGHGVATLRRLDEAGVLV